MCGAPGVGPDARAGGDVGHLGWHYSSNVTKEGLQQGGLVC